jgi:hypothetical protein
MISNVLWKKFAYQLVLIELAKVAYEMHSRKAKKVKFEIHKRTGKFVVYFDDSVYKDVNFKYGYTLAKEVYSYVSGKKKEDVENDMLTDVEMKTEKTKEELKELKIPITSCKSIDYCHKHRQGDIFEMSIEWNSLTPRELLFKELESLKEKTNSDEYRVLFVPSEYYDESIDYDVEDLNLHKMIVYYESGSRIQIELKDVLEVNDVQDLLKLFVVSKTN